MDPIHLLGEVARSVAGCAACRLAATRTRPVAGGGRVGTGIVFVGEAPGRHEDASGQPFVGACGKFLDRTLGEVGLPWRETGYLVPVVKCRPPKNRDPKPDEVAACRPHLERQMAALHPLVVVTLGRFGLEAFMPRAVIGEARGRWHRLDRWPGDLALGPYALFPTCHPAAAMRFPRWRALFRQDLAKLAAEIDPLIAEMAAMREGSPAFIRRPTSRRSDRS